MSDLQDGKLQRQEARVLMPKMPALPYIPRCLMSAPHQCVSSCIMLLAYHNVPPKVLKEGILLHPITPSCYLLTKPGPVLSYCYTTNDTHMNFVTLHGSCHTHMTLGLYLHPHILMPQLCSHSQH